MPTQEFEMLKELFSEKIDRVHDSVSALAEKSAEMDEKILEQATKTNGRVTRLEKETEMIRFATKNKIVVAIIVAALSGSSATSIIDLLQ